MVFQSLTACFRPIRVRITAALVASLLLVASLCTLHSGDWAHASVSAAPDAPSAQLAAAAGGAARPGGGAGVVCPICVGAFQVRTGLPIGPESRCPDNPGPPAKCAPAAVPPLPPAPALADNPTRAPPLPA